MCIRDRPPDTEPPSGLRIGPAVRPRAMGPRAADQLQPACPPYGRQGGPGLTGPCMPLAKEHHGRLARLRGPLSDAPPGRRARVS
eukprot:5608335-Alexandrium_andersonii.AAC.1